MKERREAREEGEGRAQLQGRGSKQWEGASGVQVSEAHSLSRKERGSRKTPPEGEGGARQQG